MLTLIRIGFFNSNATQRSEIHRPSVVFLLHFGSDFIFLLQNAIAFDFASAIFSYGRKIWAAIVTLLDGEY